VQFLTIQLERLYLIISLLQLADIIKPQTEVLLYGKYGASQGLGYVLKHQVLDINNPYFGMVVNFSNATFSGTINDFFRISTGAFNTAARIFAKKGFAFLNAMKNLNVPNLVLQV
jgi:hypothetical protein